MSSPLLDDTAGGVRRASAIRPRGIALVGFMGSGKTTVGRTLAHALGWPFLDLDRWLEQRFGPIPEQVSRDGWPTFRERERALAHAVCDRVPRVLATGGGTWLDPEVRDALQGAYQVVWLDVPFSRVAERLRTGAGRPLWDAEAEVRWRERRPAYALAPVRIDGDAPVSQVVERVLQGVGGA